MFFYDSTPLFFTCMSDTNLTTEIANKAVETVEATGGLGMLGINLKIFIAQLINFLVVLLVLWKWMYKPLVKLLDQRAERIADSVKKAQEIEEQLSKTKNEQVQILNQAKTEAAQILSQAHTDAEKRKQEMVENAKQEVQRVVSQGKEQLKAEKVAMIRDAKSEIVEIVVAAAEKILKESVDQKKSQKLAQDTVEKI